MASVPQPIQEAILATETLLYAAFVSGGASRSWLVSLDLTNKTTADITVDIYKSVGATDYYIADDLTVPAKGTATWRGMLTFDDGADELNAIASATGVDVIGTVVEDA